MATVTEALRYLEAGLSVIPIKLDGTKAPGLTSWDPFAERRASRSEVVKWFRGDKAAIGIIGGPVSGNLDRLDFDAPGIFEAWLDLIDKEGLLDLVNTLPLVKTPRGDGWHLYYRIDEELTDTNLVLARGIRDGKTTTLIETRGNKGYTVAPGSPLRAHETGHPYELVRGDLTQIPIITTDQRETMLSLARALNECSEPERRVTTPVDVDSTDGRPGDDYNQRGDWRGLLERLGWTYVRNVGETEHWRRPGKSRGISATWNHGGSGIFYCFSSNADPLETERSYDPFGLYATIEHAGDFGAAASTLTLEGYGDITRAVLIHKSEPDFIEIDAVPLPPRAAVLPFEGLVPPTGFLAEYVAYASDQTDAPIEFHLAAGLTILAAAAGNSVSIQLWGQAVYPNLWTVVLAPSGFYRKSTAISLALRILRGRCAECALPDDFTREKLIENLSVVPAGVLPVYEFGELLAKLSRDYNAGTKEFLTIIYDGNPYVRSTKQGSVQIDQPAVSILAASTIDWIHDRITGGDIRGGFLARFCYWPATEKNGWKGITDRPDFRMVQQLQSDVEIIHNLRGDIVIGLEEAQVYNDWVRRHEEEVNEQNLPGEIQGFYTRLATYVIKFAMIYELAIRQAPGISAESLDYAIRLAEYLKSHLVQIVRDEMLTTKEARELRQIKDIILRRPGITRSEILRASHMMARHLDDILNTLIYSGEVIFEKVETKTKPAQIFFGTER